MEAVLFVLIFLGSSALAETTDSCTDIVTFDWIGPTDGQLGVPTDVRLLGRWRPGCVAEEYDILLGPVGSDPLVIQGNIDVNDHRNEPLVEVPVPELLMPQTEYLLRVVDASGGILDERTFTTGHGRAAELQGVPTFEVKSSSLIYFEGPDGEVDSTYSSTVIDVHPVPSVSESLGLLRAMDLSALERQGVVVFGPLEETLEIEVIGSPEVGEPICVRVVQENGAGTPFESDEQCFAPDHEETRKTSPSGCDATSGAGLGAGVPWGALLLGWIRRRSRIRA